MKKYSRIRKGTAGMLLTVFFISFLMDGFAARVIQAFSDHDHEIHALQGANGIQLRLVHEFDHEGSDPVLHNPDLLDSHHGTDSASLVECSPHNDHNLILLPLEKSIPPIFKSASFGFHPVVAVFILQNDLFPSGHSTISPLFDNHDSSLRLERIRSIVLLV